jgi:putative transposase
LGQQGWSSAAHHLGGQADPLISDHLQYWSLGNTPFEREAAYTKISQHALTHAQAALIAESARKAWPLGAPEFLAELSGNTERRLTPLSRGRPRKTGNALSGPN